MKNLIVDDWRDGWTWATTWVALSFSAWGLMTAEQQTALLAWIGVPGEAMPFFASLLVIAGRFWSQRGVR